MSSKDKPERTKADAASEEMTDVKFMQLADKFIDMANRQNQTVEATALHMIMLYAAARYSAHVAKNVVNVEEHEPFVQEMAKVYQEMLRNHLADPNL